MLPVLLGFGSAVCWGLSDFLAGVSSKRLTALWVTLGMESIGLIVALPVVLLYGSELPPTNIVILGLLTGASGAVGLALLFHAFTIGPISIAAPIAAVGAAIPVVAGLIAGERPSLWQMIGICVAGIGVVLAARTAEESMHGSFNQRRSIICALLSSIAVGSAFVLVDPVAEHSVPWTLLLTRVGSVITAGSVIIMIGRRMDHPAPRLKDIPALIAPGLADLLASMLYALSTEDGLLSVVAVLGSLYPVTTVVLAHLVLKERIEPWQRVGVACALGGATVMGLG